VEHALIIIIVPVYQTMSDPGLGIPALPHKPADVHIFLRDLVRWDHDIVLNYQDNKKYSLRSLVVLGTESTAGHCFPCHYARFIR